jgi:antitoxin component YwqK of YwqJK toxin-antitoxin module
VTRIVGTTFEVMDGRVINWGNNGQWILDHNPRADPFRRRTFQNPSIPDNLIILPDQTYVLETEGLFDLQGQKEGVFKEYHPRKEFFYRANRTRVEEPDRLGYVVNELLMYLSTIDDSFFKMRNFRGEEGLVSTSDLDLPVSVTPMRRESNYSRDLRVGVENEYHLSVRPPPPLKPSGWSTDTSKHRLVSGLQSVVVNRQGTGIATTLDFNYLVKEDSLINVANGSFNASSGGSYVVRRPTGIFEQNRSNVRVLLNQHPVNLNLVRNFYPNYITLPGVVAGQNTLRIEEVNEFNYLWGSDSVWNSIAFGAGRFVAVGDGAVMYSNNAVDWIRGTPSSEINSWREVVYANGQFVAVASVGTDDRIMTSTDGIAWTRRPIPLSNAWTSVTFGKGTYVVVGASGDGTRVMTSPDGIVWTVRRGIPNALWSSVTFGNGVFAAVSSTGDLMRSTDGITWTDYTTSFTNSWSSITFGNNIFVAVSSQGQNGGRVITSPDGITWTPRAAPAANWTSVTFGINIFMAVARNICMTSPDGITWTLKSIGIPNDWSGVAFGIGVFATVSQTGSGNRVATSNVNGDSWTPRLSAPRSRPFNGSVVWNGTNRLLVSYFDVPLINRVSIWSQISPGDGVILADPNNARNRIRLTVTSRDTSPSFLTLVVSIDETLEPKSDNIDFSRGVRVSFVRGQIAGTETLIAVPETVLINPDVNAKIKITFDVPFASEYRILTNFLKSSISGRVNALLKGLPKQIQAGSDDLDLFRPNVNSLSQFIPRYIELGTLSQEQDVTWEFGVNGKNPDSFGSIIGVSLWSILYRLNPNDFRGVPKSSVTWGEDRGREVRLGLERGFVDVVPVFYQRNVSNEYFEFINKIDENNFRMKNSIGVLVTVPVTDLKVNERFVGYYVGSPKVLHEFIFQEKPDKIIMRNKTNDEIVNVNVSDIVFPTRSERRFFETGLLRGDDERSEDTFFRSGLPRSSTDVLQFRASNLTFFRTDKYNPDTPDAFYKYTEKNENDTNSTNKLEFNLDEQRRRVGLFKDYNTSGTQITNGNYEEGLRTGNWVFRYVSGNIHEQGDYIRDLREGKWEVFYDKTPQVKWEEINYENGLFKGVYKLYYTSGNLKEEGEYDVEEFGLGSRSIKIGIWKTYFDKDPCVVQTETNYTEGLRQGSFKSYYLSGNIREEGQYTNDLKSGLWTTYYDSTAVKEEKIKEESNYVAGELSGAFVSKYPSQIDKITGSYTNNLKSGLWRTFFDVTPEKVQLEENYTGGLLNGEYKSFLRPDIKREEGQYAIFDVGFANQSLKTGLWKFYTNGILSSEGSYDRGPKTGQWKYYVRGSPVNISKIEVYGQSGIGLQAVLQIESSRVSLNVLIPENTIFGDVATGGSGPFLLDTFINGAPVQQNVEVDLNVEIDVTVGGKGYKFKLTQPE